MRKIGLTVLLIVFGTAMFGGWKFLHPPMPPLRAELTGAMEPIDARTGIYAKEDGSRWQIVPGLDGGYYIMRVDLWDAATQAPPEKLDSFIANEGLMRLAEQPYEISAVEAQNGVTLAGWMFEPAEPTGAGIVILHGSGNSDRSNSWYAVLAHTLAEKGYTVILPDKRGSGRSGGDWREAPLTTLAEDGAAWMDALRELRPEVSSVGFLGVSQGGMIAPEAARLAKADFAVVLSATSTSLQQQLELEIRNDIANSGAPKLMIPLLTKVYAIRAKGRFEEFWRVNGDYEMMREWERWRGPLFIGLGADDEFQFIPVKASTAILERDYADAPDVTWRVYDGVRHSLMYQKGPDNNRFHTAFLSDLFAWLGEQPGQTSKP